MQLKHGYLCAVEGTDGCGKTSTIYYLRNLLMQHNIPYLITKEPGGTLLGTKIRSKLISPDVHLTNAEQTKLFLEAREDHLEKVILPALKQHQLIICDRYVVSNMAYQGLYIMPQQSYKLLVGHWQPRDVAPRPIDLNSILKKNEQLPCFVFPDLNIYLQANPNANIKRLNGRHNKSDKFDRALEHADSLRHLQRQFRCALNEIPSPTLFVDATHHGSRERAEYIYRHLMNMIETDRDR